MPHSLHLILDPPPRGFYICEDVVSGKVTLEGSHSTSIGCIIVSFYGIVDTVTEFQAHQHGPKGEDVSFTSSDRELLFHFEKRLDQADERGGNRTSREWSFQFGLEGSWSQDLTLPASGKYYQSNVAYKVVAILGKEGEDEDKVKQKINPGKKQSVFHETDFGFWARKQVGHIAERDIELVESRSDTSIGTYISPLNQWKMEISAKHLPSFSSEGKHRGLFHHQEINMVPFTADFEIPRIIIQGTPYIFDLSVSCKDRLWLYPPTPVLLTGMKIDLRVITIARAANYSSENIHDIPIFDDTNLRIPLSSQAIDLGKILPLTLSGRDVTPTFSTRLLERKHKLMTYVTLTVGDKTSNLEAQNIQNIELVPSLVIAARPKDMPPPPYSLEIETPRTRREENAAEYDWSNRGKAQEEGQNWEEEWRQNDQGRREEEWRASNRNLTWDEREKERVQALKRDFLARKHAREAGEAGEERSWDEAPPPWEQGEKVDWIDNQGEPSEKSA